MNVLGNAICKKNFINIYIIYYVIFTNISQLSITVSETDHPTSTNSQHTFLSFYIVRVYKQDHFTQFSNLILTFKGHKHFLYKDSKLKEMLQRIFLNRMRNFNVQKGKDHLKTKKSE